MRIFLSLISISLLIVSNSWAQGADSDFFNQDESARFVYYTSLSKSERESRLDDRQLAEYAYFQSKATGGDLSSASHREALGKVFNFTLNTLSDAQRDALTVEQYNSLNFELLGNPKDRELHSLVNYMVMANEGAEYGITAYDISPLRLNEIYDRNFLPTNLASGLNNAMDQINVEFEAAVKPWTAQVKIIAKRIFFMLIGLDFAWMIIKLMLKKNYLDGVMREAVKKIFLYGVGFFLVFHGDDLLRKSFEFFKESSYTVPDSQGQTGEDSSLNVGNFFDSSIKTINTLYTSFWYESHKNGSKNGEGFVSALMKMLLIVGMAVLTAYIASQIIVAYAEMYVTITATVVLFGFFVTDWTREIAQKTIMHMLSVGFKLFSTLLIARVCIEIIEDFLDLSTVGSVLDMMIILAALAACALLIVSLPTTLAAIISITAAYSPGTQIASALRSVSSRVFFKEPMGAIGGLASGNALAKAEGYTGVGRVARGLSNTASGYGEATFNTVTGNTNRESQARKSMGQRAAYLLQQKKYDLKRGYKKPKRESDSAGPPPASGGSGHSTEDKGAASVDRGGY